MQAARETLDAHVRETVAGTSIPKQVRHSGSIRIKARLGSRKEFELRRSGSFWRLRTSGFAEARPPVGPERASATNFLFLRPEAAPEVPKSRININDFRTDYEIFSDRSPTGTSQGF
jgi:hypothetical protein